MSQESQKFPLRFIFPAFCESHQHESPPVGTGARNLKRRLLGRDPYEQQYAEDFLPTECGLCYSYSRHSASAVAGKSVSLKVTPASVSSRFALVRGGGREALILADVQGVRAALSEQGAHRVGKDYEVESVSVSAGVFHPKISVLYSTEECHLLVGAGNLTFGGWGGNCEVLEHRHPSFAADAIEDTRRVSLI
jgi:hypothetical protein